ncbi:pimeloyl-ACP methyl ester carboxylesterase/heme/copper-type cytochrome/quinol oxidase subunit 4 [Flavobacterium sp. HSC-32F16]|uniref:alpha/beta fold hydrolase n=1 Tax=Flavobacterium sp. HSC-32F16 TaxID=2910964 RepID=UPI0020A4532E|nr:alpha/beta fold hydrolase [Flavobacterium sp. HSC-32F16]MCP2028500.1 pimeloyl-ACP methyl ester carboxylesterase/heme/copper-type cytochrome/quinol oxidase subunit 4 [Flavobacterium sp. HSC-32F16]
MKNLRRLFLLLCLLPTCLFSQINTFKLEKTTTFFPQEEIINQENIEWRYLNVPENWDKPTGKTIKIAVAILKCTSKNIDSNPVVYIEGGPGAGGIEGIWNWLKHPLRINSDIVLVDVRGTGNSLPKFCPDLGKQFLEILSKNQNSTQDEQQKAIAALACKQDLLNREIDINSYNSKSIAKDLNALKRALKYDKWNVYGVSYGTYTAQVYANDFPQDIKSLILDSSISDISMYYNHNTENYMNSLEKVFSACENDPNCNKQYPNLENAYYETIEKLDKKPITIKVDKRIIPSGEFTYNTEDFKIAIQQSLYQRKLIEVLPLLITEFNKGNKSTLSSLVAAFSGALRLDYGAYYCVSCNEAIPYNSISEFNKEALNYKKLKGGLSFYKSDFLVCDKWNSGVDKSSKVLNDLSNLSTLGVPVLVFSGVFDPITPASNGKTTVGKFKNGFLVNAPISGHAPSFSKIGSEILNQFISNPDQDPDVKGFQTNNKVHFVTDVKVNGGVSNFANSLNEFNLLFFAPFLIAIIILLISIFNFCYVLIRNRKDAAQNKIMKYLIILTSILGFIAIIGFVLAINSTAQDNFYILAFGIPNQFDYLFVIQWAFIVFTIISIVYFALRIKSISNKSVIAAILFSLLLIGIYFQYWGFLL